MSKKNVSFYITIVCFMFISNCIAGSELPYKEGELIVKFAPKSAGFPPPFLLFPFYNNFSKNFCASFTYKWQVHPRF